MSTIFLRFCCELELDSLTTIVAGAWVYKSCSGRLHDRATVKQKNHRQLALSGGHRVSDELNPIRHVGFSGRPASDTARRVARETAARRRRSVRAGHDAPGRAFNTPAPARTQPRSSFASPRPFFLAAAAAELPQLRRRHSRTQLAPSHSSTTAIAPPPPQQRTASSRAH